MCIFNKYLWLFSTYLCKWWAFRFPAWGLICVSEWVSEYINIVKNFRIWLQSLSSAWHGIFAHILSAQPPLSLSVCQHAPQWTSVTGFVIKKTHQSQQQRRLTLTDWVVRSLICCQHYQHWLPCVTTCMSHYSRPALVPIGNSLRAHYSAIHFLFAFIVKQMSCLDMPLISFPSHSHFIPI